MTKISTSGIGGKILMKTTTKNQRMTMTNLEPFEIKSEADYIPAERYRVRCMRERTPGTIIENGKSYPVNENGRITSSDWPPTMNIPSELIKEIIDRGFEVWKQKKTS